jgi:hypothetical protein
MLVSRMELLLRRDSSSGAQTATMSLLAATSLAESESGRLDPLGSPPSELSTLQPAPCYFENPKNITSEYIGAINNW